MRAEQTQTHLPHKWGKSEATGAPGGGKQATANSVRKQRSIHSAQLPQNYRKPTRPLEQIGADQDQVSREVMGLLAEGQA